MEPFFSLDDKSLWSQIVKTKFRECTSWWMKESVMAQSLPLSHI